MVFLDNFCFDVIFDLRQIDTLISLLNIFTVKDVMQDGDDYFHEYSMSSVEEVTEVMQHDT